MSAFREDLIINGASYWGENEKEQSRNCNFYV